MMVNCSTHNTQSYHDGELLWLCQLVILVLHGGQLVHGLAVRHVLQQLLHYGRRQVLLVHRQNATLDLLVGHFDGPQQNGCRTHTHTHTSQLLQCFLMLDHLVGHFDGPQQNGCRTHTHTHTSQLLQCFLML
eukprot:TRINITY_DN22334_c0_g1_i4.p2 TRINITY_DN22334_c0_g1~~TRINITY_DN22334_c0_g1_i4.p2  ORF type:complete len:132 (-),score=19.30 TRINITY_DN22334_c0_g1_i4:85-480(-)